MFRSTVATAVLMVGQILEILFGFTVTLANHRAFETISPKLRLRSHILVRLIVPILIYIPVSLSFATLSLPFNLPFGARYNYGKGFILYWCVVYLGMLGVGLASEAMITILTEDYIACFVLVLVCARCLNLISISYRSSKIISNVSLLTIPMELQPGIFKYGKGWPM
jgi:hypothetical protein